MNALAQRYGRLPQSPALGLTVLRVTVGTIFLLHGWLGLFVYGPSLGSQYFAQMGIPLPLLSAWLVSLGHLVGGALLVVGLLTRLSAAAHVVIMTGAVLFAHLHQGFFLTGIVVDPANDVAIAGGMEFPLVLALLSLALAVAGGGALAVDNVLWRIRRGAAARLSGQPAR